MTYFTSSYTEYTSKYQYNFIYNKLLLNRISVLSSNPPLLSEPQATAHLFDVKNSCQPVLTLPAAGCRQRRNGREMQIRPMRWPAQREPLLCLNNDESSRQEERGGLSHPDLQLGQIPSRHPSSQMPLHLLTNLNLRIEKVAGVTQSSSGCVCACVR